MFAGGGLSDFDEPAPEQRSPTDPSFAFDDICDDVLEACFEFLPLSLVASVVSRLSRRLQTLATPQIGRRLRAEGFLLEEGATEGASDGDRRGRPSLFHYLGLGRGSTTVTVEDLQRLYSTFHPERTSFAIPEVFGRLRLSPRDLTQLISEILFVKSPNIAPEPPGVTVGRYLRKAETIKRDVVRYVGMSHWNPQFAGLIDRFDLILIGMDVAMRPREGQAELSLFADAMAERILNGSFSDPRFSFKQPAPDKDSCAEAISALILAEFPINLAAAYIESLVEKIDGRRHSDYSSRGWSKAINVMSRSGNMERVARRIVGLDWRNLDSEKFEQARDLLLRCEAMEQKLKGSEVMAAKE
jgi:hypothetical protein